MFSSGPRRFNGPTLIFTTGYDPFSLSVQVITTSPFNHVAIGFGDEIIHAIKQVRRESRARLYNKYKYTEIAEFEILTDVTPGVDFLLTQVGKPYDFEEVISGLVLRGFRFMMPSLEKSGVATKGKWTCARLAMALDPQRNRIPEWWSLDPEGVSPDDLFGSLAAGGSFRRLK